MSIRMRLNEDHNVLGGELCSGFVDNFGQWKDDFFCPNEDTSESVYCCGPSTFKYCCTKKEELQPDIPDFTLILGVVSGAALAIAVITILSCLFCRTCLLYKRRHASANGPLYQMHCSSTGSGVANMYSFSNQNSSATTPIDTNGPHPLVELEYHHATPTSGGDQDGTPPKHSQPPHSFAAVDLIPTNVTIINEQDDRMGAPPPYEAMNPDVTSVSAAINGDYSPSPEPQTPQVELQEEAAPGMRPEIPLSNNHTTNGSPVSADKSSHSSHTSPASEHLNAAPPAEETLYWSTKF